VGIPKSPNPTRCPRAGTPTHGGTDWFGPATVADRKASHRPAKPAQPRPRELDLAPLAGHHVVLAHPAGALPAQQVDDVAAGQHHPQPHFQVGDHSPRSRPLADISAAAKKPNINDSQHNTPICHQVTARAPTGGRPRLESPTPRRVSPGTWPRTGTPGRPRTGPCGRPWASAPC